MVHEAQQLLAIVTTKKIGQVMFVGWKEDVTLRNFSANVNTLIFLQKKEVGRETYVQ